jgi:hypothetical protein
MRVRAFLVLTLLSGTLALVGEAPAFAACHWVRVSYFQDGAVMHVLKRVCTGDEESPDTSAPPLDISAVPNAGHIACIGIAITTGVDWQDYCSSEEPLQVTPAMVAAALARVPLPPAGLIIQPPNGRTLVNFATNFYTKRDEFNRSVRLLGQRVELRITPAQFTWHFDDGQSTTTTTPGSPYPKLEITHDYLEKGGVHPSVDTTYTADFRVNGGGWQPVPGSVTIPGEAVAVEVVEASPILVGYQ